MSLVVLLLRFTHNQISEYVIKTGFPSLAENIKTSDHRQMSGER